LPAKPWAGDSNSNGHAFCGFHFVIKARVGIDNHEPTAPHVRLACVHRLSSCLALVAFERLNAIYRDGNSPVDHRQREMQRKTSIVVSVRATKNIDRGIGPSAGSHHRSSHM
jgi:hypothetical protein